MKRFIAGLLNVIKSWQVMANVDKMFGHIKSPQIGTGLRVERGLRGKEFLESNCQLA